MIISNKNTQPEIGVDRRLSPSIWLIVAALCLPTSLWAAKPADVRTIIDVSGSMKKNDPKNLRQPALRMLVGLMPKDTYAGVWTFGQYVNMEVKWGKVDDAWKKTALEAAGGIHSRGLYTNIEEALRKTTKTWQDPDQSRRRHLLLLTDGHVDIGKDAAVNAESRRKILQEILPRIEDSNVTVHSVALSENVDFELLYAMSGSTDGWYERVNDAADLPKVFLRIFEKAVVPDALPLKDNHFKVDKSVSDVTILLFRKDSSVLTTIVSPDQQSIIADKHPKSVTWQHEQAYDLINIKKPQAGEWTIKADVDPDNRVLVVTNLRMAVDKLPTNLMLGDPVSVKARVQEKGKTLVQKDFLSLLNFEAKLMAVETEIEKKLLLDDGKHQDVLANDGVYSTELGALNMPGKYELIVRVGGDVLEREFRHSMNVYDTAASIEIKSNQNDFDLKITPHAGLLRTETVSMQLQLHDGKVINLQQVDESNWIAKIPKEYENKIANITLTGMRYNNQNLTQIFEQQITETKGQQKLRFAPKVKPLIKKSETVIVKEKPKKADHTKNVVNDKKSDENNESFDWTFVIILIVAINGVVAIGGGLGYVLWKKRKVAQLAVEDKEMAL